MQIDDVLLSFDKVIDNIIKTEGIQEELDLVYGNLCSLIYTEIQRNILYVSDSRNIRKRHKSSKPFWSDKLSDLWSKLRAAERNMNNANVFINRTCLWQDIPLIENIERQKII